ncbi:MAG: SecE/sec61-gamma family protein translocase subunit [Nitrosopumilaceae archaeon]
MNPRQTLKNMANTMKMAKKPDKDEYSQHLRLVLVGIAGVGANWLYNSVCLFSDYIW